LRRVGLERFARAYPHTLSGGMQPRGHLPGQARSDEPSFASVSSSSS